MGKILDIIFIIVNGVYYAVINTKLFTDRAMMPDGIERVWHISPVDRMERAGETTLLHIWIIFAVVSVATGILLLFGVKNSTVKTVRLISTVVSTVLFIAVLVIAGNIHLKY